MLHYDDVELDIIGTKETLQGGGGIRQTRGGLINSKAARDECGEIMACSSDLFLDRRLLITARRTHSVGGCAYRRMRRLDRQKTEPCRYNLT